VRSRVLLSLLLALLLCRVGTSVATSGDADSLGIQISIPDSVRADILEQAYRKLFSLWGDHVHEGAVLFLSFDSGQGSARADPSSSFLERFADLGVSARPYSRQFRDAPRGLIRDKVTLERGTACWVVLGTWVSPDEVRIYTGVQPGSLLDGTTYWGRAIRRDGKWAIEADCRIRH
jgi:hypothetical protein